jgi:beta-galactosidase
MFSHVVYGADYYPEQWSAEIWQEDARLMQEAGVNMVTLGVFAWAKMEPAPGQYDFTWLDQVMDLLHAHGVKVDLATPTAAPPAWLVRMHPEILPVTAGGVTLWHGSRRHYCPHSRAYRERAAQLVSHLAQHVRGHPALTLWHVDNEYACHVTECFCERSVVAFRRWLEQRYGALDGLNEAWGTTFWGQIYTAWEEIIAPRQTPAQVNPAQQLDWRRFFSDSWLECFEEQKAILRQITPEVPVTTNFMGLHRPLDYWTWAAHQDVISYDSYPDPANPEWMITAGMMYDMMRSLGQSHPWLIMEQAPSQVNWRQRNVPKRPGELRLGSYQALARGSSGLMFFQWRASLSGSEKFHSAMFPHAGQESRVWQETKALGGEVARLDGLLASRVQAEVAILFDWENWWALEQDGKPSNDLKLLPQIAILYAECFRRNITVDFAHPGIDLNRYRLVIAPHLYLLGDSAADNIKRYVNQGGTLLMTFFSGIVDKNDRVMPGGYPALLRDLLGLWIEEFVPYAESQLNIVRTDDGREFTCDFWSDMIHLSGAKALASYQRDYFAGVPAATLQRYGQGLSYYLGTNLRAEGLAWLVDCVCTSAGVRPALDAPQGVEVTRRVDGKHSWLFILNHLENETPVDLPSPGVNILTGKNVISNLNVEPKGVAIIQQNL